MVVKVRGGGARVRGEERGSDWDELTCGGKLRWYRHVQGVKRGRVRGEWWASIEVETVGTGNQGGVGTRTDEGGQHWVDSEGLV